VNWSELRFSANRGRGITDLAILSVETVLRKEFATLGPAKFAYFDRPIPRSLPSTPMPQLTESLPEDMRGLSNVEASRRREQYGPNQPIARPRLSGPLELLLQLANPLVLILLIASVLSAAVGNVVNALTIVTIVVLGAAINFVQTHRSQRAIERLRDTVAPTATALRDGQWIEIHCRNVVPGDVVRLSAGDLVPADSRLVQAKDLHVQQAALTGESMPVEKSAIAAPSEQPLLQRSDMVFMGTSVISGTATAIVVGTGASTQFGMVATRLVARPPDTEFERGIRRFAFLITRIVIFLVLFVFLINIALKRDALQAVLFSVALAVGLTPEFLPMIVAVTLARSAVKMVRRKVVVKHLAAMQNLGSIDVLCSDKTGTLTGGSMILDQVLDPFGAPCERPLFFAYLNSSHQTGVKSPLDAAILKRVPTAIENIQKLDEVPFDFERRRLSVVVESGKSRWLVVKGAPESILTCCNAYEVERECRSITGDVRRRCESTLRHLCSEGLRVLAVGYREVPVQESYHADDERDLVLVGFVTFSDPPLEDARASIKALHCDGVRIVIVTGDNELVASHICSEVGIDGAGVITGAELERMSDGALAHAAEQVALFARVSPAQKTRILLALKQRGHVVGFLGDGINDAPALHVADVGISVASAVDVARDAAEIILLERSLGVLHAGIMEGRRAFGNVMKYLLMGTSSNFGNMLSMAAASAFLPFLPMLPMQILLNNFLYDASQLPIPTDNVDKSFIHKPRRWNIELIQRFMLFVGPVSSVFDFLTFFVLLVVFQASEPLFHTGWFVESLATQTLVIFVIRTAGNPLRSRPSRPLVVSVISILLVAMVLPTTPWNSELGFVPLPATFYVFVVGTTAAYLLAVNMVKNALMRRWLTESSK
jgi:P-type Mg2+ transporter